MKKNDDVPFEVTPVIEDEASEQVVAEDAMADAFVTDGEAPEPSPVTDDVPLALTADDEATATPADAAATDKRSAWKVLSNEDLPAVSLREILGGDYLIGSFLRRNIGFILTLVVMGIVYISNRYGAQQEIIEEVNLRKELQEKKNYAQTQYAQLTMQTRQSALERRLKAMGDSTLLAAKEAPFIIFKQQD